MLMAQFRDCVNMSVFAPHVHSLDVRSVYPVCQIGARHVCFDPNPSPQADPKLCEAQFALSECGL